MVRTSQSLENRLKHTNRGLPPVPPEPTSPTDPSVRILRDRLRGVEAHRQRLANEAESIRTALRIIGVRASPPGTERENRGDCPIRQSAWQSLANSATDSAMLGVGETVSAPRSVLPEWLNRDEATQLAGISERTLRRRATDNPSGEFGKIRRAYQPMHRRRAMPIFYRDDILELPGPRMRNELVR
jgi:hypothetical protein